MSTNPLFGLFDRSSDDTNTDSSAGEPSPRETSSEFEAAAGDAPGYIRQRRSARRAPARGIAQIRWEDGPDCVFGGVIDVTTDGCLLKTEASIETGTRVDVELTIVGIEPQPEFTLRGIVRHNTSVDGRSAYGLEFVDIDDETHERLDALYTRVADGAENQPTAEARA